MKPERFNFFVPIELEKAGNGEKMKIKGIASTADKDTQGETLIPAGFDLKRFLTQGFLNWNHTSKTDPTSIVGEPTTAKITKDGHLYIEGELYSDSPKAKEVWDLAKVLEKSGSKRRLGFSIEGVALERDFMNPKIVRKAEITGCAITPTPVNMNTVMEIAKGFDNELFIEYDYDTIQKGNVDVILEGVDEENRIEYVVDKNFNIIKKSIGSDSAKATVKEDLEDTKVISKSIEVLKKAFLEGKLTDEQKEQFKKALEGIKNMDKTL